jgi:hypothetical protein
MKQTSIVVLILTVLIAVTLAALPTASAEYVTFDYSGPTFTSACSEGNGGNCYPVLAGTTPLGTNVTATATFNIPSNYTTPVGAPISPIAWSLTAGSYTINNNSSINIYFTVGGNLEFDFTNGQIVSWVLGAFVGSNVDGYGIYTSSFAGSPFGGYLSPRGEEAIYDSALIYQGGYPGAVAGTGQPPALSSWTLVGESSSTPIPGAVWLFGSGPLSLVGLKRKYLG